MSTTVSEDGERQSEDSGRDKLLEFLPTSLAVVTGALTAVGGLTGGIARMFRNNPTMALVTLLLAVAAILLALFARFHQDPRSANRLLAAAMIAFAISLSASMYLAVDTAKVTDRPSLSAELTQTGAGDWTLEGSASASGLKASGSMQVYIYAIPRGDDEPRTQLFFVTAGPTSDGVAVQKFSVPVPTSRSYRSFVVTAALGDEVRYCDGTPLKVSAGLKSDKLEDREIGRNACLTVRPPSMQAEESQAR